MTRKMTLTAAICTIALLTGLATLQFPGDARANAAAAAAAKYEVEDSHASVYFKIRHMGVSYTYGRFNDIDGSFTLGEPSEVAFDIIVKTASVDTANASRDNHLKSPDFFNAEQFPMIRFKSTKVEKDGDGYKVTGDMTMLGKTRSITVDIDVATPIEDRRSGKMRGGFDTEFTIKRSDFGMTKFVDAGTVGDEVKLGISMEGLH